MIHAAEDGKSLAEREAEYEQFVWANLKRNYIAHYLHGMLGMTGFLLVVVHALISFMLFSPAVYA